MITQSLIQPEILEKKNKEFTEEIEQAFLGNILYKEINYDSISWVKPNYFFFSQHGAIFEKIKEIKNNGKNIIPQQLQIELVGIIPDNYIKDLLSNCVTGIESSAIQYAETIYNLHLKRAIKDLARNLDDLSRNPEIEAKDILEKTESFVASAYDIGSEDTLKQVGSNIELALEEKKNPTLGILSSIREVDKYSKGYKNGGLYIIAARPAMGKTALALSIAANMSIFSKRKVMFFSLEMPLIQLQDRLLSRFTVDKILQADLFIDEASGLTVTDIITRARRQKRKYGLDIIFIDYLGLMSSEEKNINRTYQIEEITRRLKNFAKEINIPIVLLCQLNRESAKRDDKRPTLTDLRDSGAIEQDADVVMFLHRESYYEDIQKSKTGTQNKYKEAADMADLEVSKQEAEVIFAKNRQGKTGIAKIKFIAEQQLFCDKD
jgi:replicative DNA helicase